MFSFMNSRVGIFTSCMCSSGTKTHYERAFLKKTNKHLFRKKERSPRKKRLCYLPALYFIALAFKLPFLDHLFFWFVDC